MPRSKSTPTHPMFVASGTTCPDPRYPVAGHLSLLSDISVVALHLIFLRCYHPSSFLSSYFVWLQSWRDNPTDVFHHYRLPQPPPSVLVPVTVPCVGVVCVCVNVVCHAASLPQTLYLGFSEVSGGTSGSPSSQENLFHTSSHPDQNDLRFIPHPSSWSFNF
jgi:hypothetical protein